MKRLGLALNREIEAFSRYSSNWANSSMMQEILGFLGVSYNILVIVSIGDITSPPPFLSEVNKSAF